MLIPLLAQSLQASVQGSEDSSRGCTCHCTGELNTKPHQPVVSALAEPTMLLHSWCCDNEVLCYIQVEEIGTLAKMKEHIYSMHLAILDVPLVVHRKDCTNAIACGAVWEHYWHTRIGRKVRKLEDGSISNQLWFIQSELIGAKVPGMNGI